MIIQRLTNRRKKDSGFTIVELLIVIVVIGILAGITIVAYSGITARANTTKEQTAAVAAQKAADAYNAENGSYPATTGAFSSATYTQLPGDITIVVGAAGTAGAFTTDVLTGTSGEIAWSCATSCTNTTGGRLAYWDFQTGARSTDVIYVGDATAANDFVAPAS